jgi:Zn-dependent protease
MHGSFKLGTLAGIDIRAHYTWLLAIFLIAWSLALGYFPMSADASGPLTYWLLGVVAAPLLFASVLVHELGHSLRALARAARRQLHAVHLRRRLHITREPTTAKDEFLVAVVGPLISLALPIVQNGALVGVVSRAALMRYLQSGARLSVRSSGQTQGIAEQPKAAPSHG